MRSTGTHKHTERQWQLFSSPQLIYSTNLQGSPDPTSKSPILCTLDWDSQRDSRWALRSRDQEDWNWSFLFGPTQPSLASCHHAQPPIEAQYYDTCRGVGKESVISVSLKMYTSCWQVKSIVVWICLFLAFHHGHLSLCSISSLGANGEGKRYVSNEENSVNQALTHLLILPHSVILDVSQLWWPKPYRSLSLALPSLQARALASDKIRPHRLTDWKVDLLSQGIILLNRLPGRRLNDLKSLYPCSLLFLTVYGPILTTEYMGSARKEVCFIVLFVCDSILD